MDLFEWDESFCTGIPHIDEQHQRLISMISDLDKADREGTGGLLISYVLQELMRYVTLHFEEEEQLMMSYDFPGLVSHRQEHDFYVMRLKHVQESYHDGDALSKNTLAFLKDWISCHIKGTDQIYAEFIRTKTGTVKSN
ncbi:bacteriohemerythrin [Pelotalea chapellei]|uniref:Hemerythrin family protein n=1 Tax=Pelotalea chapellei TaxID=44671 RepID=A0ABS5U866_9BACT|nr:bacteriohemerythrin [Pelotalea chapellei]MBT1071867.1 hemerythrin family protein [Pelotalea chapellei]